MISVSNKHWGEIKVNKNLIEKIKQENNFSDILAKLIIEKNFDTDEIYSINNKITFTNVFQNNKDFRKSLVVLDEAITNKYKVCIIGDYDVDGSAATALLVKFFESINHPYFYYIPDRVKDGYGVSINLFKKLIQKKPKLVIMLDCASTAIKSIDYLNINKIKSIIIDHHEIATPYPKANAIINPKKDNGYKKYDYLCATALTYFFLDLLLKKFKNNLIIKDYLIYVLLATVCDVMPLRKLNRTIAINTLDKVNIFRNKAINEIYNIFNKKNKVSINDLGFFIGPILNAGGRLGKSSYATELLSTNDENLIKKRINNLILLNEKRKKIEDDILKEIDFNEIEKKNENIIIIYKKNINEGLIGIIAARLKEYFNKPSIIITNSGNLLKGSARSIHSFNIGISIKNAFDKNILINGGGHNMAAGFSLNKNKLNAFIYFMNINYNKNISKDDVILRYTSKISSSAFNKNFFDEIKKIEPFGNDNHEPTFLFEKLKILKSKVIKDKHISIIFKSTTGFSINSFSFNSVNTKIGDYLLNYKKDLSIIGQIKENFWNNKYTLQLIVKDLVI